LPKGGVDVSDYGMYDTQSFEKEIMVTARDLLVGLAPFVCCWASSCVLAWGEIFLPEVLL
jgi:hypothetical protein